MSASQLDMFGGSVAMSSPKKDPYTPPAYPYPTCWEDCELSGRPIYSQRNSDPKKRVFAVCERNGYKCFESDAICQNAKRITRPEPAKPQVPGWEDY